MAADSLKIREILIVEDEPSIRECLSDFFGGREWRVTAVATLGEARRALASRRFSMILLDLVLPDGDGLDLLQAMRRHSDLTPTIVLTAKGEEVQRIRGLTAGADDYVIKPFSLHEVLARVEAVSRRSVPPPAVVVIGDAEVDFERLEVKRGKAVRRLIPKEAELLAFFLRHPRQTFAREDLLREVWGYDHAPTTRTVDTHVFHLRQKVERCPEAPRHFVTVFGIGYRFEE